MSRLALKDPHRRFLRRKLLGWTIAYVLGAAAAVLSGMGAGKIHRDVLEMDFDARGLEVPRDLRDALASRDPSKLRAAAIAHPRETFRILVDREHGLPGAGDAEYEEVLASCAAALPLGDLRTEVQWILHGRRMDPLKVKAALKVLELSPDPLSEEVIRAATRTLEGELQEEARRILEKRKAGTKR